MIQNYLVDKSLDIIKKNQNNIILFGEVGSGKTTLINKLCDTKYTVKEGGYSCTRDIQFGFSPTHDIIIDCPGLNAAEEISRHLKTQKFILSVISVKIICFVIKLYTRYDLLLKTTIQMLKIFHEHRNNIVIIITFSERISSHQKKDIQNIFAQKFGFDEKKIIFSSNNVKGDDLLKKLNEIKDNVSNISSINFNEKTLLNSDIEGGLEIIEFREKKINEYKIAMEAFKRKWNITNNYQLQYALLKTFNYYKLELIDSFKKKLEKNIQDLDTINVETIIFSNELYEQLNIIKEKFEKRLSNTQLKNLEIEDKNLICGKSFIEVKYCENGTPIRNNIIFGKFQICKIIINLDNYDIYIITENNINNVNIVYNANNELNINNSNNFNNGDNQRKNIRKSVDKIRTRYNINDSNESILYKNYIDNTIKLSQLYLNNKNI